MEYKSGCVIWHLSTTSFDYTSEHFQDAGKTPVDLLLRRKARLTLVTDINLCEPVLFKATSSRLWPDNIRTDSTDRQTNDLKIESSTDNIDVASPNSAEKIVVTQGKHPSGPRELRADEKSSQKKCKSFHKPIATKNC